MDTALSLERDAHRVIRQLWRGGPRSRIGLAQALGLTPAALTRICQQLLALHIVEETGPTAPATRGRPSVPLRILPGGGYALGVTLSRGALDIAVLDIAGGLVGSVEERFDSPDPRDFVRTLRRRVLELSDAHDLLGQRILGLGLAVPGPVTSRMEDRWHLVESLAQWRDIPLREMMTEALALPVWVANDANVATLAEYYLGGLAERCATAVVILLAQGIGAGVIDNGWLLRGENGNVGEIGCFYPLDRPRPSLLDLIRTLQGAGCPIESAHDFAARTKGYEPIVRGWTERAAQQLEQAVNGAIAWFDPGEIVLTGPLPPAVLAQLAARLNAGNLIRGAHHVQPPPVSASGLAGRATTLGAGLLPLNATLHIFDGIVP